MRWSLLRCPGIAFITVATVLCVSPGSRALAQLDLGVPPETAGADGIFAPDPPSNPDDPEQRRIVRIVLSLAGDGHWTDPPPNGEGSGVYDCEKRAIVFKYASVTIPAGVTVKFENHPSFAPVVWLVEGDVTIEEGGIVDVSGASGSQASQSTASPGPGGFRGGRVELAFGTRDNSAGFGPGGGDGAWLSADQSSVSPSRGGSYGSVGGRQSMNSVYGNEQVVPLIGGSGGGAGYSGGVSNRNGGGAGGGAILIAATDRVLHDGVILANGGDGVRNIQLVPAAGGSGGAIRIVASEIRGDGELSTVGGSGGAGREGRGWDGGPGGHGRIRLEALDANISDSLTLTDNSTRGASETRAVIWPEDLGTSPPTIRIVQVDEGTTRGSECSANRDDSRASLSGNEAEFFTHSQVSSTVLVETTNLDPKRWSVSIRAVNSTSPRAAFVAEAASQPGSVFARAFWAVSLSVEDDQVYVLQARARRR